MGFEGESADDNSTGDKRADTPSRRVRRALERHVIQPGFELQPASLGDSRVTDI